MWTRRQALGTLGRTGGGAVAAILSPDGLRRALHAAGTAQHRRPEDTATDEDFWLEIQQAFTVDRTLLNLNNGGIGLSARPVHDAFKHYLDVVNQAPTHYMWEVIGNSRVLEQVRQRLAATAGCDAEEIALTRNATEANALVQMGLDLKPGDEVLMTDQEHPGEDERWNQRARRDGITLVKVPVPTPPKSLDELTSALTARMTARTKVLFFMHVSWKTGQAYPVQALCAEARRRGILSIVDGAHGFAHLPTALSAFGCDAYGTSLHKWLGAPMGTGFLYVRRDVIPKVWTLMGAPARRDADIRKFEWSYGTYPTANVAAIAEALTFHGTLGPERKLARLRYLTARWAERVRTRANVRLYTSLDHGQSGAIATVGIEGVDPGALARHLWDSHRIMVVPRTHPGQVAGVRVTPHLYTTLAEIDRFADVFERIATEGLPRPS
jgi:selenocysteine lyase/cysteine desulfurase